MSPITFTRRRSLTRLAVIATTAALLPALSAGPAAAAPIGSPDPVVAGKALDPATVKLAPTLRSADPDKVITVFVQPRGVGALRTDADAKGGHLEGKATSSAAQSRLRAIETQNNDVVAAARTLDRDVKVVYTTKYTVPGVALSGRAGQLAGLATRPGVVSVSPVVTKKLVEPVVQGATPQNSASDVFTRAVEAWRQTGKTGRDVHVAVIDTGLDYTHADFGGQGTKAAYTAALSSTKAPSADSYDHHKFLGGYDFAGRTYNADSSSPVFDPVPAPDPNPIDGPGGGHGTHVAGTIAGYGLNADGTSFTGSYASLSTQAVRGFKIGPGTAPGSSLYSLKVFGDYGGATDLTGAALDWIGQALTEGKQINVMNLSLGSNYTTVDDPDNAKIDALVDRGVLPVISAGNSGDLTDIAGSPGNSLKALAVAASDTGHQLLDGVAVTAPADLAGKSPFQAQYSINYVDPLNLSGSVATLADPKNFTGCSTFNDVDTQRVTGKIAWLQWDDDNIECSSAVRFSNATAAGAVGVILTGTKNSFSGSIGGNYAIPGAHLTLNASIALKSAAQAGTLNVSFRDNLREVVDVTATAQADTLADFSSRGVHGSYGDVVKPDIAAPGVNVSSAHAGTGNGREQLSGTSMAAPHTAGVAALAIQAHPTWSTLRIKADLMNTATHDLHAPNKRLYSLERQGTGRVDALQAVQNQVTVESKENPGLVTASFGVVDIKKSLSIKRTLVLTNHASTAADYAVDLLNRTVQPGVSLKVDQAKVSVPAGGTAMVHVTLSVPKSSKLRRSLDPTSSAKLNGFVREFVAAATGYVTFSPLSSTTTPLRVGVFSAPKPVSTLKAKTVTFAKKSSKTATLITTGTALSQGGKVDGYQSVGAPFVLSAESGREKFDSAAQTTLAASDLRRVGASSTAPTQKDKSLGILAFGVQTWGALPNPGGPSAPDVLIDVSGDGRPDFETTVTKIDGADVTAVVTYDIGTNEQVDVQPYNMNVTGTDPTTFDSSVAVLPVSLKALGYTKKTKKTKITYQVRTQSSYAPNLQANGSYLVDSTKPLSFDVYKPTLWFSKKGGAERDGVVLPDSGKKMTVHRTRSTSAKVLMLHMLNTSSKQSDVVKVRNR